MYTKHTVSKLEYCRGLLNLQQLGAYALMLSGFPWFNRSTLGKSGPRLNLAPGRGERTCSSCPDWPACCPFLYIWIICSWCLSSRACSSFCIMKDTTADVNTARPTEFLAQSCLVVWFKTSTGQVLRWLNSQWMNRSSNACGRFKSYVYRVYMVESTGVRET